MPIRRLALAAAERIRRAVAATSAVTASVGVAMWVRAVGSTTLTVFAAADEALYAAKAAGRDQRRPGRIGLITCSSKGEVALTPVRSRVLHLP